MTLSPHTILKMMGFDIPEEGVQINPHDALFHQQMLRLLGTTLSPDAITEREFAKLFPVVEHDLERAMKRGMYTTLLRESYCFKMTEQLHPNDLKQPDPAQSGKLN